MADDSADDKNEQNQTEAEQAQAKERARARAEGMRRVRAERDSDQKLMQMAAPVTDKMIRQLLVELTKHRATKLLDTVSDKDMDNMTLFLVGTSAVQVLAVRRWLALVALPHVILGVEGKEAETPEPGPESEG